MKALKVFLLTIIAVDILALGVVGFFAYKVSAPLNNFTEESRTVTIEKGEGLDQIALKLKNEGVLPNASLFTMYTLVEKKDNNLKAGTYTFTPEMSIKEIANMLTKGNSINARVVTFPEGFTGNQMAERLVEMGILNNENDFLNIARLSAQNAVSIFDHSFLRNVSANSLEGFLFPDTYEFRIGAEPETVLNKLLTAFENKAWTMLEEGGTSQAEPYDAYELLIIASLLEEEVQTEEDMKLVAGILYNRLELGMPLQVDATLAYITGKKTGELTNADKEIESPYNTYQNTGLPPAPISNPGLKALGSALNPTTSDYLYYLTGKDGTTHFARTLDEHNDNKQRYLK